MDYRLHHPLLLDLLLEKQRQQAELTSQPLPTEGAMRASETVSEASPSSTASQTGVPTQVVQQVQGSQQVRHGLRWGEGGRSPHFPAMNICLPVSSGYGSSHPLGKQP